MRYLLLCIALFAPVVYPQDPQDPPQFPLPDNPLPLEPPPQEEEPQPPPPRPVLLETIIPARLEMAQKRILFIVDTSGSMIGDRVVTAISTTMQIAESPVDDFQVAAVSFGSGVLQWAGTQDIDPNTGDEISPPGWSAMPSAPNLRALGDWLFSNQDKHSTELIPAIELAFNATLNIKDLSIVVISDCEFNDRMQDICKIILDRQEMRQANSLPPASIGFFGVDVAASNASLIKEHLSGVIDLGFYNHNYSEPAPDGPH